MTTPDWSTAPEDAQFFMPDNKDYIDCWVKKDERGVWYTKNYAKPNSPWYEEDDEWLEHYPGIDELLVPRPSTSESENSWIE